MAIRRFRTCNAGYAGGNGEQRYRAKKNYIRKPPQIKSRALEVHNEDERRLVASIVSTMVNRQGQEKTTALLNGLDKMGARFMDLVHYVDRQDRCGTQYADDPPTWDFNKTI